MGVFLDVITLGHVRGTNLTVFESFGGREWPDTGFPIVIFALWSHYWAPRGPAQGALTPRDLLGVGDRGGSGENGQKRSKTILFDHYDS